jgi:hypothetical protein
MVEDSIKEKFSGSSVSVVGVDVWNASDSLIGAYLAQTGITFPIAKKGAATATSFGVVANSVVVVDQNGTVQYVKQLGTASTSYAIMRGMVSEAASTVRRLLANSVIRFSPAQNGIINRRYGCDGDFTLSGRRLSGRAVSTALVVSTKSGKPRMKMAVAGGSF